MPRIGFGYDVHRLVAGRELRLGGIVVPFELGLAGHSDADVLLHAITDALLGAAALGDIGTHFPPSDDRWKGADSRDLLAGAASLLVRAGWQVVNLDSTIVAERPRLGPHIPAMRAAIARVLGLDLGQVSVKAKTTEGLGFTGTGEGMAAYATALIEPAAATGAGPP
ncbi:MAG TPA: 2-C-methyl-D-erythritol 2,4-cyclodiphosphate synthase [Chloroflexia bacterium]|nr:2-C-methyl-D-erythritol 2,4-cyclodiphosphate synthase [Chloroflexia bacterium]